MAEFFTYLFVGAFVLIAGGVGLFFAGIVIMATVVFPVVWLAQVFGIVSTPEDS